MKFLRIIIVLAICLAGLGAITETQAQHRPHKAVRPAAKAAAAKKAAVRHHRYHRNNAVVVRKANLRRVETLPAGARPVTFRNTKYHFHKGFFYQRNNDAYVAIMPPRGIRIGLLPLGYKRIVVAGRPYFYYQGVYYVNVEGEETYEVVDPPVDAVVDHLPDDNMNEVQIEGETLYEVDGSLYKPEGDQYRLVGSFED